MKGRVALPRKNGELVFQAPWESRAFGMAVALSGGGLFPWRRFQELLVAEISSADGSGQQSSYYEQWLAALERLAIARGLVTRGEVDRRVAQHASAQGHGGSH